MTLERLREIVLLDWSLLRLLSYRIYGLVIIYLPEIFIDVGKSDNLLLDTKLIFLSDSLHLKLQ